MLANLRGRGDKLLGGRFGLERSVWESWIQGDVRLQG